MSNTDPPFVFYGMIVSLRGRFVNRPYAVSPVSSKFKTIIRDVEGAVPYMVGCKSPGRQGTPTPTGHDAGRRATARVAPANASLGS